VEQATRWQEAARAALEPYPWRRSTAELLARRVLGAVDDARGTATGGPAARADPRLDDLVAALSGLPWRALTTRALSRHLVEALVAWEARDRCLDLELQWLLDGSP
jgi:hypothetical protein